MSLPPVDLPAEGLAFETLAGHLEQRADILASLKRLQVTQSSIKAQRAGHLPTLSLTGSSTRNWSEQTSGRESPVNKHAVALSFSLPIFSGGETVSLVREARADRDAQRAALDQLKRQARRQLRQAIAGLESAQASQAAFEAVVTAGREALTGVTQEFEVGTRTSLDVLDAQDELFSAETDLAKSRYSVVLARYTLLNALGRLTLESLGGRLKRSETGIRQEVQEGASPMERFTYMETATPSSAADGE